MAESLSCLQFTMVTARWQAHGSYDEKDVWLFCALPIHHSVIKKMLKGLCGHGSEIEFEYKWV